jgi:hypothetical protein
MFAEEGLMGASPHTGLLWALETFAWEPRYLSQVALIFAKLVRLDPGGKLLNRPFNSLCEIFLCWNPQTPATLEQRLRVIDTLSVREPEVTWKLLCSLLPEISGEISDPIHRPRWRDWNAGSTPKVTWSEYWESIDAVVDRVLSNAGTNSERWCDIIKHVESLPPRLREQAIDYLLGVDITNTQPADLVKVWSSLREVIHKHREFPDADWAMPTEVVDRLRLAYQKFEPEDLVHRYAWIFSFNPDLPDCVDQDWETSQDKIKQAQTETARNIYYERGVRVFLEMATHVEEPRLLGSAISKIETISEVETELLRMMLGQDNKALNELAIGFVCSRLESAGWNWAEEMLSLAKAEQWSAQQSVNFFYGLPFEQRTWNLLAPFGEELVRLYWQTSRAFWVHQDDRETAIRNLLGVNRPYAALNLANLHLSNNNETTSLPPALLVELLEKAVSVNPYTEKPLPVTSCINYHIEKILHALDRSDAIEDHEIARLEWMYLPVLTHSKRQPKLLHQELSKDPLFFVEILKFIYRSENDRDDSAEPDKMTATRFKLGYKLLESWNQVPGLTEEGRVDLEQLRNWVLQARTACQQSGRGTMGDQKIGKVLAYAPKTANGIWPDLAVREVIEEVSSRELELGIEIGVYNKRGVRSKPIGQGGLQERQLAETYQNYATAVGDTHPRTAAMLRRIADGYDSDAYREDIRAELED